MKNKTLIKSSGYLTPLRMATIKKAKHKTRIGGEVKKLEPSCIAGGTIKWCALMGNSMVGSPNIESRNTM